MRGDFHSSFGATVCSCGTSTNSGGVRFHYQQVTHNAFWMSLTAASGSSTSMISSSYLVMQLNHNSILRVMDIPEDSLAVLLDGFRRDDQLSPGHRRLSEAFLRLPYLLLHFYEMGPSLVPGGLKVHEHSPMWIYTASGCAD